MNRICIEVDERGQISSIAADSEIEIYIAEPSSKRDTVYHYQLADIGQRHVQKLIAGYRAGLRDDQIQGLPESLSQPRKPTLKLVR